MSEFEKWLEKYDDGDTLFTTDLEAAWDAALASVVAMFRTQCESTRRLQRINRGNHCPDAWQTPPQWCQACRNAHAIERMIEGNDR
jgi:hypothetical protein